MRLKILLAVLIGLFLFIVFRDTSILTPVATAPVESTPVELIKDSANIFDSEEIDYIREYHQWLLDNFDLDYRIITLNGQDNINQFTADYFNREKIGSRSRNNRGLLLVIDKKNDIARLEISAILEPVFTDTFVAYVENRQMVPFFKEGKVAEGVFATSEIIRIRARDAAKGNEYDDSKLIGSIGGGATAQANIGKGKDFSFKVDMPDVVAADDPEESLRRYVRARSMRNGRSDLNVFTPASREFMATLPSTPARMDNSVKRLKNCVVERVTYNDDKTRAVLFHSLQHRECDPFLFEKGEDGKWRMDLKALGLGTNHTFGDIWYVHFGRQEKSGLWKYYFGFKHLWLHRPKGENGRFDHQGIPYYHRYGINFGYAGEDVLITDVHENGVMDKLGIQTGDRIVEWEGGRHINSGFLKYRLANVRPGLDIPMIIRRDGKLIYKMVKAPPYPKEGHFRYGFSYQGYSPRLSRKYVRLPMVYYVDPLGPGKDSGLMSGDIIQKWQDIETPTVQDIGKSMRTSKGNEPLRVKVYRDGELVVLESVTKPLRKMSKVH